MMAGNHHKIGKSKQSNKRRVQTFSKWEIRLKRFGGGLGSKALGIGGFGLKEADLVSNKKTEFKSQLHCCCHLQEANISEQLYPSFLSFRIIVRIK